MQIVNYKEVSGNEKILATFGVNLGEKWGVTYPNLKVIKGKTGGYFIGLPSYLESEDAMGNKIFGKYPTFTADKWKSFSAEVMELLKPFLPAF